MSELNKIQHKLLKQVSKHRSGISSDRILINNKNAPGIIEVLVQLQNAGYLTRLVSEDDKARQVMQLPVESYTGAWVLTDKGYAEILNRKLESKSKIIAFICGFASGVISTVLSTLILKVI